MTTEATQPVDTAEATEAATPEEALSSSLAARCAAGTVALYRQRATGTLRRLPWLTGEALEVAEWLRLRREEDGVSVRALAEEAEMSRASVRRALAMLDLMDSIAAGDYDDAVGEEDEALIFCGEEVAEEE